MSAYLALYEDRLIVSQPVRLPAAPRALFVREGVVEVESGDGHVSMQASECRLFESTIELRGTATVWSFEIGAGGVVQSPAARELSLVLAHDGFSMRSGRFSCKGVHPPTRTQGARYPTIDPWCSDGGGWQ